MVSKKILAVAIAAALSSSAFAVTIDPVKLNGSTTAVKYAKEAILTTAETEEGSGYYAVTGLTSISSDLGFGVASGDKRYVLIKLNGAVFTTDVDAATDFEVDGAVVPGTVVAQGGNVGDDYVIMSFTADADYGQDTDISLAVAGLAIKTSGVSITVALYETGGGAQLAATTSNVSQDRLYTNSFANAITVGNALSATFTATNAVADVASDFTDFVTADTNVTLGTVTFALDSAALLPNSAVVTTLDEVASDDSDVTLTGDLSFGTWDLDGCSIVDGSLLAGEDCVLSDFNENQAYPVSVSVDGETTINPGEYSANVDYVKITDAAFSPVDASGALGQITRNGTQIYIANFSTVADYNQRLVLVNRSSKPAPYSISFTTEAGVTATPGAKATGVLAANSTTSLKAVDVVTITGPVSRTAATVNVTAQKANIDAATTLVNTVTKSTDTVKLDNN
jgi:hypothetical protein